jgi:tetratricopeptide (TPR) repeat protein
MLLRKEPRNYEGYFWLGFTEFAEGELYRAVRHLRHGEALRPPANATQKVLAVSYLLLGQNHLFEFKMKEAIARDPSDFAPFYLMGRYVQFNKHDPVGAVSYFRQALERRSNHYPSIHYIGISYELMGRPQEAKTQFEHAVALAEHEGVKFSLPYRALARLTASDAPYLSLNFATRSVALEPKLAPNYLELAKAYTRVGRLNDAVDALETAAKLDPAEQSALYLLFTTYNRLGNRAQGARAFAEFKRITACYGND